MASNNKINLAVLISGRGSNLQSIIDACQKDDFPARISVVLSNVPDAYGLERARQASIPTEVVNHKDHDGRENFERAMIERLTPYDVDLVCLAGFMRVLTPLFIQNWPNNRMINIHPSLLPAYKGLNTHARALADGQSKSGCTIHYVVPELDSGPIIVQKEVPITGEDTTDSLAARVLEQEHVAYPEAIARIADEILN